MKKMISLFALVLAFHNANATSLVGSLMKVDQTLKGRKPVVTQSTEVFVNGVVIQTENPFNRPGSPKYFTVTKLNEAQVQAISALIARTTPVIPGRMPSNVRCFAPATHTEKFTANSGQVFLREGAACDGGWEVNLQPAALQLTKVLSFLESAGESRMSHADIEKGVDHLLMKRYRR